MDSFSVYPVYQPNLIHMMYVRQLDVFLTLILRCTALVFSFFFVPFFQDGKSKPDAHCVSPV